MSNFDFLKNYDDELYKSGVKIENNVNTSPAAVKTYATPFLQRVLELLMDEIGQNFNPRKEFYYQLDTVYREGIISYGFKQKIYQAYQLRNHLHDDIDKMEKSEIIIAQQLHERLFYIAKKLYRDHFPDYNHYEGVPSFKPVAADTSDDEVEFIKIPDFSEVIDIKYDYCIICGEPNHSNYSLCCEKCNRVMDNANNFISIRNSFGKDARFTKEDLIDYGIPEGYVNQLINSMVRENMLSVKGRYITFNNMYLDDYLTKIVKYISVCELITKFREDKITPDVLKKTREYKQGRLKEFPFYQFYKIANREIIKKFEAYLINTEDLWFSMEYTTISQDQLKRWYQINLGNYKRGKISEAFTVFNRLLIKDYLSLKRQGILESDIKKRLNVSDEIYDFWVEFDRKFTIELKEIKLNLLSKAILDGKTRAEVIEYAGVTPKEYDDIVKVSNYHNDDFAKLRNQEIESRKKEFVKYLLNFDLRISCRKAKITLEDFYIFYDSADESSDFFIKSTEILMDKYLHQRKLGKTRDEAIEKVQIKQKYVDRWLSRSSYAEFKDRDLQITVDLILKGFKQNKPLSEISRIAGVSVKTINYYLKLGERGSEMFEPLFDYYENVMIPERLSGFLSAYKTKSLQKSLKASNLTRGDLEKYYELGKNGDERFTGFYEEFFEIKKRTYVMYIFNQKTHKIAMKESYLTQQEYEESRDDLEEILRLLKFSIVLETISNNKTSNVAARKAHCSVDEIYEWYFKGRSGDEDYRQFYEAFHDGYVRPSIVPIQEKIDNENATVENLIRSNREKFTKKDVEIWLKHGLINVGVLNIDEDDDKDEEDDSKEEKTEIREIKIKGFNKVKRSSLGRIESDDDAERLKNEILK